VRLAALDLMEISEVDLEGPGLDPGISEIPGFHLNSRVSHFLSKCHLFCVNSVESVFLMREGIHGDNYSGHRDTFLRELSHFSDSSETVDSRGVLSSPGRSFLTPKSRV